MFSSKMLLSKMNKLVAIRNMMTKAQTLKELKKNNLSSVNILDLYAFKAHEFQNSPAKVQNSILEYFKDSNTFIVRSSSADEDQVDSSNAGKFESVLNVRQPYLKEAIEKVINSYDIKDPLAEEIFVQPMLENVGMSGVLFTRCPKTSAPYYVIEYNSTGDTAAVTSGTGECHTRFIYHSAEKTFSVQFDKLVAAAKELMQKLDNPSLDIEFGFNDKNELFLFQVRPLVCKKFDSKATDVKESLESIKRHFKARNIKYPYLHGDKTILGVMPDWNPAEIIGIQPTPLALSLYKELIMDNIWACQRDDYGYKNLRNFPLLVDLCGLPYVDVRVSFNSFLPKDLPDELSEKLVNYYLSQLEKKPYLHDKVEFDIIFSCYTFNLKEKLGILKEHGFSEEEITTVYRSLRSLTNSIVRKNGLWYKDAQKIAELKERHEQVYFNTDFDDLTKIYWLIQDCKTYGTLPFAGLARAAFIAVQMLQSMVDVGVLSREDQLSFLNSLDSVSTNMTKDFQELDRSSFLQKYGHLRPGTYDILSSRYDEDPDSYFKWENRGNGNNSQAKSNEFKLSMSQMNEIGALLKENGIEHDVVGLFSFMKAAIEGREHSKFVFAKSLSDVLSLLKKYGMEHGITAEDLTFLDIKDLMKTYSSSYDHLKEMNTSIQRGREKYQVTERINLPPLIGRSEDIECFELPEVHPNFITKNKVTSPVISNVDQSMDLEGSIVFIPSADPGYDWLFTRRIAGFVTAYGGINSHMSIRAAELNIPAIIGAGKVLYDKWSSASKIHIDCEQQRVKVVAVDKVLSNSESSSSKSGFYFL